MSWTYDWQCRIVNADRRGAETYETYETPDATRRN